MSKKITVVSRILLSLLLILSLCLPIGTIMVSAEEDVGGAAVTDVSFNFDADYGQTEAREMLDLVNGFRTSPTDAWHWASNNTDKVSYDGEDQPLLEELAYDYTLEEVAMQRAAEIAILFDHVRPDGSAWSTAFPLDEDGNSIYSGRGENIAWGVGMTAEAAYTAWREDPCDYDHQGHRRNMLSPNFNCIGIGHCQVNGVDFWVQSLGYKDTPDEEETDDETVSDETPEEIPLIFLISVVVDKYRVSMYAHAGRAGSSLNALRYRIKNGEGFFEVPSCNRNPRF